MNVVLLLTTFLFSTSMFAKEVQTEDRRKLYQILVETGVKPGSFYGDHLITIDRLKECDQATYFIAFPGRHQNSEGFFQAPSSLPAVYYRTERLGPFFSELWLNNSIVQFFHEERSQAVFSTKETLSKGLELFLSGKITESIEEFLKIKDYCYTSMQKSQPEEPPLHKQGALIAD